MTYLRHTGSVSVCRTPACLAASSHMIGARNSSYSPCDDMWQHSCGGWISNNRIPDSRSSWSLLQEMAHRVQTEQSRLISMFSNEPSQVGRVTRFCLEWLQFILNLLIKAFIHSVFKVEEDALLLNI